MGPFAKAEILKMLEASYISVNDVMMDSRNNTQGPIREHEDFKQVRAGESCRFYVSLNSKEYGPINFLFLLSLVQLKKIELSSKARLENDLSWKRVEDFVNKDFFYDIEFSPLVREEQLPTPRWKRKNIRIDYDEVVLLNNANHTLVAKALDISSEAIALIWVHAVPVKEEFELSLIDREKKIIRVKAILTRKELLSDEGGESVYKAVFTFTERISMKNFIE